MDISHYLYNAFLIEAGDATVAIDPGQNLSLFNLKSLIPEEDWPAITHLVITHGDPDHHWHSDRVAAASGAHVICGKELTRIVGGKTLVIDPRGRELTSWVEFDNLHPLDVGESVKLGGVRFEAVRSVHGPIEVPVLGFKFRARPGPNERVGIGSTGFMIDIDETRVLNLGDSILLPDWEGLSPDVLMLPIGGFGNDVWTMDVDDAIEAVRMIAPKHVIPCHYSVPLLWKRQFAVADDQRFASEVRRMGVECTILKSGQTVTI